MPFKVFHLESGSTIHFQNFNKGGKRNDLKLWKLIVKILNHFEQVQLKEHENRAGSAGATGLQSMNHRNFALWVPRAVPNLTDVTLKSFNPIATKATSAGSTQACPSHASALRVCDGIDFSRGKRSGYCMILQSLLRWQVVALSYRWQEPILNPPMIRVSLPSLARDHFCCTKPKTNDILGIFRISSCEWLKETNLLSMNRGWNCCISTYTNTYVHQAWAHLSTFHACKQSGWICLRFQVFKLQDPVHGQFPLTQLSITQPVFLNQDLPPHGVRYVPQSGQWLVGLSTLRASLQPKHGARRCLAGHQGESEVANGSHTLEIFGVGIDGNLSSAPEMQPFVGHSWHLLACARNLSWERDPSDAWPVWRTPNNGPFQ